MCPRRGSGLAFLTAPPTRLADLGAAASPALFHEAATGVYLQMHLQVQLLR
jgi:hypothetical protein